MRRTLLCLLTFVVLAATAACGSSGRAMTAPAAGVTAPPRKSSTTLASASTSTTTVGFALTTTAWPAGGRIPTEFTCDGAAPVSPPLQWSGIPEGVSSLALVMSDTDDTDAVQWLVVDLPAANGSAPRGTPPTGGRQLTNSFGSAGYAPPCPVSGTHTYELTILGFPAPPVVDAALDPRATLRALQQSATVSSQITGRYSR